MISSVSKKFSINLSWLLFSICYSATQVFQHTFADLWLRFF